MINIALSISTLFTFIILGCNPDNTNDKSVTGYNLSAPDASFILPDVLHEISGLSNIDATSVACIQDEQGIVFIYDIVKKEIKDQFNFSIDGDYEGIARVDKTLYILRSDGALFEISNPESKNFDLDYYDTGVPAKDNEGLCYDKDNNRLLIACKSKVGKGDENKDKRLIYAFDLKTNTISKEPVFDFDIKVILQFALNNKINLPTKKDKKDHTSEPVLKFRTSEICINPVTKKLFLLSADDHLLFIFNMKGKIEQIAKLNPEIFNQAEGLTFFENGDMLISNEGQDKKPTLLRFNYKKN
jgi:hypothetical protein